MTLHSLTPGDIFTHAKSKAKNPTKFIVKGNPMFNRRHGSATRYCFDLKRRELVSKSCRLEVVKVGESKNKQRYMELANKK
jgi:hypothetical protein